MDGATAGVESFVIAAQSWLETLQQLGDEEWNAPATDEWTVRELAGHMARAFVTLNAFLDGASSASDAELSSVRAYFDAALAAPTIDRDVAERGVAAGAALGDDPKKAISATVRATLARLCEHAQHDPDLEAVGPTSWHHVPTLPRPSAP